MEYFERVQAALLRGDPAPPTPAEPVVPFEAIGGAGPAAAARRTGSLAGAAAAAMVRCVAPERPDKTAMAIIAAVVAGEYDEVLRAVAPRSHVIAKTALLAVLAEPGEAVPGVRVADARAPDGVLDDKRLVALRALASVLDAEFCLLLDQGGEVFVRPANPERAFGGRAVRRFDVDLRGTSARAP